MREVLGRNVQMVRTHYDPMIGPKPRLAFVPSDMNATAYVCEVGVVLTLHTGAEHLVPFANIQSIKLEPLPPIAEITQKATKAVKAIPITPIGGTSGAV